MGYGDLSVENRSALLSIARMAYGTGFCEGEKGGAGHIGLVSGSGRERVVKFDMKGGVSRGAEAIRSSDDLRMKLLRIAEDAHLDVRVRDRIRTSLGLGPAGEKPRFASLLDRKTVAQVVTLIGGKSVWTAAKASRKTWSPLPDFDDSFSSAVPKDKKANPASILHADEILSGEALREYKQKAEDVLGKFREYANAHRDGYVKLVKTEVGGETKVVLGDAGRRNLLRDNEDELDNNLVRNMLYKVVLAHYDGQIPQSVQEQMTNFDQGGHPLSTERIRAIIDAMTAHDTNNIDNVNNINNINNVNNINNDIGLDGSQGSMGIKEGIEQVGANVLGELHASDIDANLFESKESAIRVIDEFVSFARHEGGSGSAYVKVFGDAQLANGEVRLGRTQAEEKYHGRTNDDKEVNNKARKIFYSAVERIYDGNVPENVRRLMTNDAYDGRPLSAKRVNLISQEIKLKVLRGKDPRLDVNVAFELCENGGALSLPDEWLNRFGGQYKIQAWDESSQSDDLSIKNLSAGHRKNFNHMSKAGFQVAIGQNLPELIQAKDIGYGTGWSKDMRRMSKITVGGESFNGSVYYGERLTALRSQGIANAEELAERETAQKVKDMLARHLSKGVCGDFAALQGSNDEKMKKLILFAAAHMTQGTLAYVKNDAMENLDLGARKDSNLAVDVQVDEKGGLTVNIRSLRPFGRIGHVYMEDSEVSCDDNNSYVLAAIKVTYSGAQLDAILNSDFNVYAATYKDNDPGRQEDGVENTSEVVEKRVASLDKKLAPPMVLKPEIKTAHVIQAKPNADREQISD